MNILAEIDSVEIEITILSRMLNKHDDLKFCSETLKSYHFSCSEHKLLFDVLVQFYKQKKPTDIHLVLDYLKQEKLSEKTNGPEYIFQLYQMAPLPLDLTYYISILKDYWAKREALGRVQNFTSELSKAKNIPSFLENFSKGFLDLSKNLTDGFSLSLTEVCSSEGKEGYLAELAFRRDYYRQHKKPFVDGVSTGYLDLDSTIGGFGNSNLIILASRPGMGKTALALNLAQLIAKNHTVGFVSLEMSAIQLYERLLSFESEISSDKIREGRVSDEEWFQIEKAQSIVSSLPIFIQEGSYLLNDLIAKIRQLKEEKNIKLIFIDYLQLIRAAGETRLIEISNITRDLKNLAMELHIPIVCLAQLSRKVEERTSHRPFLSDLRESGSIEQDADVVMFLLRPDYYNENERPCEADLIIAKNRHGKTGDVFLHFSKEYAKFEPLIQGDENEDGF